MCASIAFVWPTPIKSFRPSVERKWYREFVIDFVFLKAMSGKAAWRQRECKHVNKLTCKHIFLFGCLFTRVFESRIHSELQSVHEWSMFIFFAYFRLWILPKKNVLFWKTSLYKYSRCKHDLLPFIQIFWYFHPVIIDVSMTNVSLVQFYYCCFSPLISFLSRARA